MAIPKKTSCVTLYLTAETYSDLQGHAQRIVLENVVHLVVEGNNMSNTRLSKEIYKYFLGFQICFFCIFYILENYIGHQLS